MKRHGLSLRSQWLARHLKKLREARGHNLVEVAEFLQGSSGTISRIETAQYPVKRTTLLALLEFYEVSDKMLRDFLIELRDECWRKGWWDGYRDGYYDENFFDLPWLESRAVHVRVHEPLVVPGLLQTREYAAAVLRNFEGDEPAQEQITRWANLRMERQGVLTKAGRPAFHVVIEEAVLRRHVGGRDVMYGQLTHLLEQATHPKTSVRVLPYGNTTHPTTGTFMLFELDGPYPDVAYIESLAGRVFVEDSSQLDRIERVYAALNRAALSPSDSLKFIASVTKELSA